jgi:hypothetical protein
MLHEFALDPDVLTNWKDFRYFVDNFGVPHGRLISEFPKRWRAMVYEATKGCSEIDRKRIEESLKTIKPKLVRRGRPYDGRVGWLENAEAQHQLHTFHAIIAHSNPRGISEILLADDCHESSSALWCIRRSNSVPGSANELARQAAPLLEISNQIVFVDPYFNPHTSRFLEPLRRFIQSAVSNGLPTRLEYHLRADYENAPTLTHFQHLCHSRLPELLPQGIGLRVIRWNEKSGGREFHKRYILTERGGIMLDPGLASGGPGELTTLHLLEPDWYQQVWRDFRCDTSEDLSLSTYDFADETIVNGTIPL